MTGSHNLLKSKLLDNQLGLNEFGGINRYLLDHYKIPLFGFVVFFLLIGCTILTPQSSGQIMPVKVLISEEGMYKIKANDLRNIGWDIGNINPDLVEMVHLGRNVPIWVEGRGSKLEIKFYGMATDSKYTSLNPYFLTHGESQSADFEYGYNELINLDESNTGRSSFITNTKDISTPEDAFIAHDHVEENFIYVPLVEDGDTWLWDSLTAPREKEYDIVLKNLVAGEGKVTIEVWGSTEAPVSPDHHIRVAINNFQIVDEFWDGVGRHTITTIVPPGTLQDGKNVFKIETPGDTGAVVDMVYLDWLKFEYPRKPVSIAGQVEFVSNGQNQRLSGFSGTVFIYDITDAFNVIFLGKYESDRGSLNFKGSERHKYLAIGPEGYHLPESLIPVSTDLDLFNPQNAADYVVIGPYDLLEPINPLLEHRESQGLKVMSIPVDVVFDRFSYGKPEPEGIRSFLRFAHNNWVIAPKYVLLLGDATYDPRGYISDPKANRIPTFMVNTFYGGETASDLLYVQIDDDMLPDLAVGRVPARDSQQVQIFVEKLISYENHPGENAWRQRILAIADHQDPLFKAGAETFLNQFPAEYQTDLITLEQAPNERDDLLIKEFEEGNLIVSYFGHGSIDMWGKDQLFTAGDAAELQNKDRLPVVLTMTCLNGLFTHPEIESLAEALLWNINGGAVAALAPTSLTVSTDQSLLSRAIVDNLAASPEVTLGETLLNAQRQIPSENSGAVEVMLTFLLFGDPATRLAYP